MSTIKADNFTWKTGETSALSGVNVTGDQIVYGVSKYWAQYNGSTQSVNGSYNLSSVTYTAAGNYTSVFTVAFADTKYSFTGSTGSSPEIGRAHV